MWPHLPLKYGHIVEKTMSTQERTFSDTQYVPYVPSDDVADFELLSAAILRDEAAVIRTRRKSDGEEISLIVIFEWFDDNHVRVIPIAELVGFQEEFERPDSLDVLLNTM